MFSIYCNAIYVIYIYIFLCSWPIHRWSRNQPSSRFIGAWRETGPSVPCSRKVRKYQQVPCTRIALSHAPDNRVRHNYSLSRSISTRALVNRACAKETLLPWLRNSASGSDKLPFIRTSRARLMYISKFESHFEKFIIVTLHTSKLIFLW